jgi:4-carboxymuconolactone decarboxylase
MVTQRRIMNFIASLLRLGAALGLAIAPEPAQAQGAPKPKRFPQLTLETLDPQARPLAEEILKISSVGIAGPYNVMLRSPVFA